MTVIPQMLGNIHGNITQEQLHLNAINQSPFKSLSSLLIENIIVSIVIITISVIGYEILPLLILSWNSFYIG